MRNGGSRYDTAERADLGDGRTAAERHGGDTGGEKQRTSAPCGGIALPGTGAAAGRAEAVGRGMQPRAAAGRRVCCLLAGGRHRGGRDALKQHPSGRNCSTNAGLHPLLRAAAGAAGPGRDFAARRCNIGARPIDLHLEGLARMGAKELDAGAGKLVLAAPGGLHGTDFTLRFPSVGATETLLLAAVCARGTTVLRGAAGNRRSPT